MRLRITPTHAAALVAVTALTALTASCGPTTTGASSGEPGAPTATSPAPPSGTPSPTSAPSSPSTPGKDVPGMPPATPPDDTWSPLIRVDSAQATPATRTVTVHFTLPTPCAPGLRRAEVSERQDAVVVTLRRMPSGTQKGGICAQVINRRTVDVQLDAPIGDRPVVDGSSGREVKVGR